MFCPYKEQETYNPSHYYPASRLGADDWRTFPKGCELTCSGCEPSLSQIVCYPYHLLPRHVCLKAGTSNPSPCSKLADCATLR